MKCPLTPSLHFSQPVLGPKKTRLLAGVDGTWENDNEATGEDNTIAFKLESVGVDGRVEGCSSLLCMSGGTLNLGDASCILSEYRFS
jgi:hypothetical protein